MPYDTRMMAGASRINDRGKFARSLWLALIICGVSSAWFGISYLMTNALLPPPPEGWRWTLCVWDCGWYKSIAEHGFDRTPNPIGPYANYGFFPAFSVAASVVMRIGGLSFVAAGLVLNGLLSFVFCALALRYRDELWLKNEKDTVVFLIAFLVSPWSLYNHIPYSEMIFNVCVLGAFVFWRRKKFPSAAAFGFVLSAARPTGVILPFVLAIEMGFRERKKLADIFLYPGARVRTLAVMPLGLVVFMFYLYAHVGDPLAYQRIKEFGWGAVVGNPVAMLWAGIFTGSLTQYGIAAFVVATALLTIGVYIRRIPAVLASFAWMASSASLVAVLDAEPRYALAQFPIYLLVPAARRTWLIILILLMLALGQSIFIYFWLQHAELLV